MPIMRAQRYFTFHAHPLVHNHLFGREDAGSVGADIDSEFFQLFITGVGVIQLSSPG